MKSQVHIEGDRVWIDGLKGWTPGQRGSSVHAAQEAVMQALGENLSYEYLLGVSGLAFRMQISKEAFCPSSPHSLVGYQCITGSTRILPLEGTTFVFQTENPELMDKAREAIVDSIDRGIPVQYGSEEYGIIVGYQKKGAEWICFHPMHEGGKKNFIKTTRPRSVTVYSKRKTLNQDTMELVIQSLRQAVMMAATDETDAYFVGFKAWDEYIKKLEALEDTDEKIRKDSMTGNAWIYECLVQYRNCAAGYLDDISGSFSNQTGKHLNKAARLYKKMSLEILTDKEHSAMEIAPFEGSLKDNESWTKEMRLNQIRRLREALLTEQEAITEIREALRFLPDV